MANIIPVPSVTGENTSSVFGEDTMQAAWPNGRSEFDTPPFIPFSEDTFAAESASGNRTFGGT